MKRLLDKLFTQVDAASLGAFRILFGVLMTYEALRYFQYDHIRRTYLLPKMLFPYEWLPFVAPWPAPLLYVHFAVMAVAAAGIALGFYYRASAATFLVSYAYVFLLDKAEYNNHYYLIALLAFLLLIVDGQRWMSVDQWRRPKPEVVPFWNLFLLRAQIFIVFFYAGIAKLDPDWLGGEPMRTWLAAKAHTPVIGPWLTTEMATYFFSYGGLLFDLLVGFLLLSRRTLPLALAGLVFFNLTNHWLFSIGVFPFLVLSSAILFEAPDLPRRVFGGIRDVSAEASAAPRRGVVVAFLGVYLAIQALVPLRHFLYPGSVSWNEEGHRFAWHMKLRSKHGWVHYEVIDPSTGQSWRVDPTEDLTRKQRRKMAATPDMIVQYAHYLKQKYQAQGVAEPVVHAESWISLNRRPPQALIDPEADLASEQVETFASAKWIQPLDEAGRPSSISVADFGALALRETARAAAH